MSDENTNMKEDPWKVTSHEEVKAENQVVPVQASAPATKNGNINEIRNDFGLVSMVCGIISLILGFSPWGILGLIFGILSKRGNNQNSQATAGIVCSIISIALGIILIIVFVCIYISLIMRLVTTGEFNGFKM
ncbi:MAG: DUF4190 domain-containing protein [Treponema sp.]|nr:DUF4190 domain-containing protein [Treponema sp.]